MIVSCENLRLKFMLGEPLDSWRPAIPKRPDCAIITVRKHNKRLRVSLQGEALEILHIWNDKNVMQQTLDEQLIFEILAVVEEIPEGKVATYGQIARLIGKAKNARLVGKVLSLSGYYGTYPCHRVVNHAGRLAPGWPEQAALLAAEGVDLTKDGRVDLNRYRWEA